MIIEYVNGGTLQNILKKSRSIHEHKEHNYRNLHGESQSLSSRDLTSFAYQVSVLTDIGNETQNIYEIYEDYTSV